MVTAAFLTEDSYPSDPWSLWDIKEPLTLNRYVYCIASPTNHIDPSGYNPLLLPWIYAALKALLISVTVVSIGYVYYEAVFEPNMGGGLIFPRESFRPNAGGGYRVPDELYIPIPGDSFIPPADTYTPIEDSSISPDEYLDDGMQATKEASNVIDCEGNSELIVEGRLAGSKGLPLPQFPEAKNITIAGGK